MYMPTTAANISVGKAREILQQTDKLIRTVPEVQNVFGKAGRAESATDPADLVMMETSIQLKPRDQWRPGMTPEKLKEELDSSSASPASPTPGCPHQDPHRHAGHRHQDPGRHQDSGARSQGDPAARPAAGTDHRQGGGRLIGLRRAGGGRPLREGGHRPAESGPLRPQYRRRAGGARHRGGRHGGGPDHRGARALSHQPALPQSYRDSVASLELLPLVTPKRCAHRPGGRGAGLHQRRGAHAAQ